MPAPLPVGGLTAASIGLTAIVVGNAYYQKKQFYPSVVYITKSNPSMAAIYFLAFTVVILLGKLLKKVFFGQLRTAEFEQLIERSFYAVTETCLAFTVFRDDFSPKFVALFTVLLFLKAFHYLTDSRVDFMERSPVITLVFHIRVTSLLMLLMLLDLLLLNHSYLSTITHGASVQLVFGFEYAILLTVGLNIAVKYLCHTIDLRSENPWENKAVYLLYTELLVGFVKVVLYAIFLFIMIRIHTFPLFIIRPMYLTIRSFKNALNDVIQSRRAIHNMNTLYPDATVEELAAVDNVCIICREEMLTGAKKLPCGHIFHSSCLRSWFQRQQTCPTCRMDILQQSVPVLNQGAQQPQPAAPAAAPTPAGSQQQAQTQPQQPPQDARLNQQMGNPFSGIPLGQNIPAAGIRPPFPFPLFPFNHFQQLILQQQQQQQQQGTTQTQGSPIQTPSSAASSDVPKNTAAPAPAASTSATATSTNTASHPSGFPFSTLPPFLPFMPFSIPPPPPPPNFEGLTLEELNRMEGTERIHVEARIKTLKNIQVLLDAAAIQLSQYNSIVSSLEAQAAVSNQAVEKNLKAKAEEVKKEQLPSVPLDSGLASRSSTTTDLLSNCVLGNATSSAASSTVEAKSPEKSLADTSTSSPTSVSPKSTTSETTVPSSNTTPLPTMTSNSNAAAAHQPLFGASSPDTDPDDPQEIRRRRLEKFSGISGRGSPPPL